MNHEQHQTPLVTEQGDDDLKALERAVQAHLNFTCGEDERSAKPLDFYLALAHVVRDHLMHRWLETRKAVQVKRLHEYKRQLLNDAQERAGQRYLDRERWERDSLLNVASSSRCSSDRAIRQYADDIWALAPVRL